MQHQVGRRARLVSRTCLTVIGDLTRLPAQAQARPRLQM